MTVPEPPNPAENLDCDGVTVGDGGAGSEREKAGTVAAPSGRPVQFGAEMISGTCTEQSSVPEGMVSPVVAQSCPGLACSKRKQERLVPASQWRSGAK